MEIPENLRELVDQLGQALVQALATDDLSRSLARKIQHEGFEVALMIEATVALHKRDESYESEQGFTMPPPEPDLSSSPWSEDDRAFLRTFKISLD